MGGKIERLVKAGVVNLERTEEVQAPAKVGAVGRSEPEETTAFGVEGLPQIAWGSTGHHVGNSAEPEVWASPERSRNPPGEMMKLAKLPPAQKKAKVAELIAQSDALHSKILDRAAELDQKWVRVRMVKKTDALSGYATHSRQLEPKKAEVLKEKMAQVAVQQQKVDKLIARIAKLPPAAPDATTEAKQTRKQQRSELAADLKAARNAQRKALEAVTAEVDQQGLMVDRLALTEAAIDPNAPPKESAESLLSLITAYTGLLWVVDWLNDQLELRAENANEDRANEAKALELRADEEKVKNLNLIRALQDKQKERTAKLDRMKILAREASARRPPPRQ